MNVRSLNKAFHDYVQTLISEIHTFVYYYLIDNMKLKILRLRTISVVVRII
jgi:hypothetical protein